VHAAIDTFVKTGEEISVHPAARWAVEQLRGFQEAGHKLYSEVIITDKKMYASAIDILDITPCGSIFIFDTKAGNFMRDSVSWQLGIYKYFLYIMTGYEVSRCYCISTKDKDIYPVIPRIESDVKNLLYGGRP
jgi:CRISPR/Cas system-associated exonuclease Cas4 (RecB family)